MTRRTTILASLLAAVLVAAIAFAAVISTRDDEADSGTPAPAAEGVPSGLEEFYTQKLSWNDCGEARVHHGGGADRLRGARRRDAEARGQGHPVEGRRWAQPVRQPGRPWWRGAGLRRLHGVAARRRGPRQLRHRRRRPARRRQEHAGRLPVRPRARRVRGERARPRRPGRDRGVPGHHGRLRRRAARRGPARSPRTSPPRRRPATSTSCARCSAPRRFDWFGASYGTELGATYATLFPKTVGRMVLDGAVDPSLSAEESAFGQTTGFQRALDAYIDDCVKQPGLPAGSRRRRRRGQARRLRRRTATPTRWTPASSASSPRASRSTASPSRSTTSRRGRCSPQALTAAFKGDGSVLLRLSDAYFRRQPDGSYSENLGEANPAINCLDAADDDGESTLEEVQDSLPRFAKASPVFGPRAGLGRAQLHRLADQGDPPAGRRRRHRLEADRRARHHPRPGHAVRVGQGAGRRSSARPSSSPARATATPPTRPATSASSGSSTTTSSTARSRRTAPPARTSDAQRMASWWRITSSMMKVRNFSANAGSRSASAASSRSLAI